MTCLDDPAYIYARLSRDDELEGDSNSIINQITLLKKVAKEKGYTKFVVFYDDGVSGVTMNRPQFNEMMANLEMGKAKAVFVKDLSRLGRNYIEVGRLMEEFFPEHGIRLVAVSDGVDTAEGENELTPIKNLFNEWYSRDISKKRRLSNKIKGMSGESLSLPPYGYIRDPDNPKRWIIDDEAACVVRKIFSLFMDGLGVEQIATALSNEKILTPAEYALSKKLPKAGLKKKEDPYLWRSSSVHRILTRQEYCGDVINFKTYSISYKNKKRHKNDPESIVVFKDVHDAIIDRDTFEYIKEKRTKQHRKPTSTGEANPFTGILKCGDCGCNLNYHFNHKNPEIRYFNCPNYNKGSRKTCFTPHYIRTDFLEQIVLAEIRRITRFASHHEEEFTKAVAEYSKSALQQRIKVYQDQMQTLINRDKELDRLFETMYEDNVSGKISDDRFVKMSRTYEKEQTSIAEQIHDIRAKCDDALERVQSSAGFVAAVKKYTYAKKLTPRMLGELIDYIEVFNAEKESNKRLQRIVIHYRCIGVVSFPDEGMAPISDVSLQTRKGVVAEYIPMPVASAV